MKIIIRFLLLFLLSFPAFSVWAGKNDSLENLLHGTLPDSTRLYILNQLARSLRAGGNYDQSLAYSEEAIPLAEKIISGPEQKDSVFTKRIKSELGYAWNNKGEVYRFQGIYPKAMEAYLKLLSISEEIHNDRGIASADNNMGIVFNMELNYPEALKYFQAALDIRIKMKDTLGMAASYNNIGTLLYSENKFPEAMEFLLKAEKIFAAKKDRGNEASVLNNIASIFDKMGDAEKDASLQKQLYLQSVKYQRQSLELKKKPENKRGIATSLNNLGGVLVKLQRFEEADSCLQAAYRISQDLGASDLLMEAEHTCSQYYFALGDHESKNGNSAAAAEMFRKSIAWQQESDKLHDASLNDENTKKIFQMQFQYRQEKLDRIRALEEQSREEKRKTAAEKQRIILYALGGGLSVTLALSFFIYRGYRQKQRANEEISLQKQVIEAKQKEILDSIHYARRIQQSLLPTEKYIHSHFGRKNHL